MSLGAVSPHTAHTDPVTVIALWFVTLLRGGGEAELGRVQLLLVLVAQERENLAASVFWMAEATPLSTSCDTRDMLSSTSHTLVHCGGREWNDNHRKSYICALESHDGVCVCVCVCVQLESHDGGVCVQLESHDGGVCVCAVRVTRWRCVCAVRVT